METKETKNRIEVFLNNGDSYTFEGNYYLYREDYKKEGCVHFKDGEGKHHRIYGGTVIVDEE